ncbi:MAG: gluconolactonase [Acetivibrionales bacterium]|jgi:DNA-binding beta-propeller fold protein YncE
MKCRCMVLIVILTLLFPVSSYAAVPYESYNYDYFEYVVPSPAAYVSDGIISGADLGVGNFIEPSDFCVSDDGKIYVSDTGNNRIVIFNNDWSVYRIIDTFENNGGEDRFNKPAGIYVNKKGRLYIADSENRRVVILDPSSKVYQVIEKPQSDILKEDFDFVPLRVGVDYADRVFVICRNVFQGILSFDEDGRFYGFTGTIKVSVSLADLLWRALSTKSQRKRQELFVPTEFTGLDLDDDGFIYTTNIDMTRKEPIKRVNPKGEDVLKKQPKKSVSGDIYYLPVEMRYGGPSQFQDIVVRDKGIYSAVDSRRGKVFTYDYEGNLLYIFGSLGTQAGTFKRPAAIEELDGRILVLDQERGLILPFRATKYGELINTAVGMRYDGKDEEAVRCWEEVLKLDANFELAYVGIGKSYLARKMNREAMEYFRLGMNQRFYSIAYKRYRNEVMKANMAFILTAVTILVLMYVVYRTVRKLRARGKKYRDA